MREGIGPETLLRRAAVAMVVVAVVFGSSVWIVIDRWPPGRSAGGTVVASYLIGLVPPAFLAAAARRLRDRPWAESGPESGAGSTARATEQLLGVRQAARASGAADVANLLLAAAASTVLLVVALPFAVFFAFVALVV